MPLADTWLISLVSSLQHVVKNVLRLAVSLVSLVRVYKCISALMQRCIGSWQVRLQISSYLDCNLGNTLVHQSLKCSCLQMEIPLVFGGFAGKTNWDQARVDMIVDCVQDMLEPYILWFRKVRREGATVTVRLLWVMSHFI